MVSNNFGPFGFVSSCHTHMRFMTAPDDSSQPPRSRPSSHILSSHTISSSKKEKKSHASFVLPHRASLGMWMCCLGSARGRQPSAGHCEHFYACSEMRT